MNIQPLNTVNHHSVNPSFGLKISKNAQVEIIDEYKNLGASDQQIIYALKKIKLSQPDKFELQHAEFEHEIKNSKERGDKISILTKIWMSDGKRSGEFNFPRTYEYSIEAGEKYNEAETRGFYLEHLLKSTAKAVEKLNYGNFKPSPIQKYRNLIEKSEFNPYM